MHSRKTIFISGIIAAIISIVISLGIRSEYSSGKVLVNDYDLLSKVVESGTIRAAYAIGAPLLIIDPNSGDISGIFYDIVTSAAERLHIDVNWNEEVGYGEMIQGLNDRRYDIIGSGVWINSDRARSADFTIPVYYDAVFAFTRVGDDRFIDDLSILNSPKYTISTMDGELGAMIAKKDFPRAKTLELPQFADFAQLILNVISNKADIVFLAAAPARAYQKVNPNRIASVRPNNPLRIFPNAIMFMQGQYRFRQTLNYTLMEMLNSGEIDTILSKYEEGPNSYLRISVPFER